MTAPALVRWTEDQGKRALAERSGGSCEGCGRRGDLEFSHRVRRSQGGTWSPVNGLHLCRPCHHWQDHHAWLAKGLGWEVDPETDPATAAAWMLTQHRVGPGWHLLVITDDGTGIRRHVVQAVTPEWEL